MCLVGQHLAVMLSLYNSNPEIVEFFLNAGLM